MSSILKALEKVEDAQHAKRSGGSPGLGRKRESRPAWLVPAWAIGGAAVATLATFAAMGGFSRSSPPAAPAAKVAAPAPSIAPPESAPPAPTAPAAPAAQSPVNAAPGRKIEVVEPQVMPDPQPQHAGAAKAAAGTPKPVPKREQVLPAAARKVQTRQAAEKAAPAAAVSVTAAALYEAGGEAPRPEISVTGIAWQGDSRSSFAMVNGRAVRQGDLVEGLRVERISENSVRFSGASGSVTVPLGAGE